MYRAKKFHIQKWIGKYQSEIIYLYGGKSLKNHCYGLEEFFAHFPTVRYCHEFSVTDIAEYREFRLSEGRKLSTLDKEIRSIRKFYTWLIDHNFYPGPNPALAYSPLPRHIKKKSLTLIDVRRILSACDNPLTRDFVLGQVTGDVANLHGKTWKWHSCKLQKAFELCGLEHMKLRDFRLLLFKGVLADLLRLNEQKLRDAFISEAELNSDAFRDIQIAPTDIRPPVSDSDLDFFVVDGID